MRRQAASGSARLTGIVCDVLLCLAWIHDRGAPLHPYIPYYNRAAALIYTAFSVVVVSGIGGSVALDGMPSSVAQVVYRRLFAVAVLRMLE
nr:MAG TPA: hypothetical protein [Caudoviricetes sp.]